MNVQKSFRLKTTSLLKNSYLIQKQHDTWYLVNFFRHLNNSWMYKNHFDWKLLHYWKIDTSSVSLIMLDCEFESRNWNSKNSCNCLSYAITNIFWKKIFLFSIHFLIWKKLCSIWGSITFFVNLRSQLQISNSNES